MYVYIYTYMYVYTLNELYTVHKNSLLVRSVSHRNMFRPLYVVILRHFVIKITKEDYKQNAMHL